ncbi:acyl-peptide hydrolase [Sphaerisporangium rufum]|uniref:Acyl-peptide hydrolase n=1 Tax=Sphaerisporangium rufum TaxID=1381558 RepID=A0A919V1W3_9ACTN|nr:prolyl oligopeptidase family serine peptidase [Sphaerisporangium rufum]GII78283.1 acyl-peptide hydrolase [Sphaerisporangium rufum]
MPPEHMPGRPVPAPDARPISTADLARAEVRPRHPTIIGGEAWWEEDRPAEHGRRTIVHRSATGAPRELLPAPWDARTRVHEYGGRAYAVVPGGGVVFTHHGDQRLYLLPSGPARAPRPLSPEPEVPGGLRYAEPAARDGRIWCVRERHSGDGKVDRAIVSLPLSGGEPVAHVTGSDFYAAPVLSPDGAHLAYICWDHPLMPWIGTELRVTRLADGRTRRVTGGPAESVLAPVWKDERTLYLLSDRSGWWNLMECDVNGGPPRPLCPAAEEFAWGLPELGGTPYAPLADGRLAVLHGRGDLRLAVLDPATGALADAGPPYPGWVPSLSADGLAVCGVAYGPGVPHSVVRVDAGTGRAEELRRDAGRLPAALPGPRPRPVEIDGRFGRRVHAIVHPPAGPDDPAPPYVVFVHDGPAAHATTAFDPVKAYLTGRGIGVLDVDHGGSTGYGRAYRDRLRGGWGVVDVQDVVAAAEWLLAAGPADPRRIAVRGFGAGGWTALGACCDSGLFAGGVAIAGVTALGSLAAATHDFESRYVEWLAGPADPARYAAREPLARAGRISCPTLLMHGLDDPVVPAGQSEAFADALAERGVSCAFLAFDGEAHGLRRAETRSAALAAEFAFYQQIFQM